MAQKKCVSVEAAIFPIRYHRFLPRLTMVKYCQVERLGKSCQSREGYRYRAARSVNYGQDLTDGVRIEQERRLHKGDN